ncbi:MHS family MFS transporter [Mycobacterium sp. 21AC1]|nr:MHS family MFS transporter [Mycobacterium sp. 21AC1]
MRRVAAASVIGTAIEWYDFFIYAQAAALVLNGIFFPTVSPLMGVLLSFATLGAGFVARPLGAIIFGHYGDRIGRKKTLVITLLMMGLGTFVIGLLPGYEQIGYAAPVLLVICRLLQGLAVGGEWGGAALIGIEHAPADKKTLYGSFAQLGSPIGLLGATGVTLVTTAVAGDVAYEDWGWRVPFLLSIVLIPVGFVIRSRIHESEEFAEAARRRSDARIPLVTVFKTQLPQLAIGLGAFTATFLSYYLLTSFMLVYATEKLGLSTTVSLPANVIAAVVQGFMIVLAANVANRIGSRRIAAGCAVGLLLWTFPSFYIVALMPPFGLYLVVSVSMIFLGAAYSVLAADVAQLFSTEVRYTGASLSYHFAAVIGGGFGPVVATAILDATGGMFWIAIMTVIACVAMCFGCLAMKRFGVGDRIDASSTL